ncbi:MAG TPA: NAD-dependent epimerase/dehydratase family protein [Rhabdochlamydiaceae bacterium]|nr:NAD-dependent epimerase/dehydratase family protein [Rhabdochlamydiaceae bacterium]
MKILLTGASGYIGSHLLPFLLEAGHHVFLLIRKGRDPSIPSNFKTQVTFIHADLLDKSSLPILSDLDAAYYLVHSMSDDPKHFGELEEKSCYNFLSLVEKTKINQIIYLSGLHQGSSLSAHFRSRLHIEELLKTSTSNVTIIRSSIIIGSDSASFKIIRDLVEKLPIMIAPRWLNTRCQPIAVSDVLYYLIEVLQPKAFNKTFEIGGPDIITFKEMLLTYAKLRGLRRWILTIPILTPRLSSYWLYFVTKVNFSLASSLVESLKIESVVKDREIQHLFPHVCLTFEESIRQALTIG